jgi:hypothetical protein
MGKINYRAVHARTLWRKVGSHLSLEAAINGKDGAAGLFAGKARIDYGKNGDPLYVIVWESGATSGFVIKPDPAAPGGIRKASIPIADVMAFESDGQASQVALARYF